MSKFIAALVDQYECYDRQMDSCLNSGLDGMAEHYVNLLKGIRALLLVHGYRLKWDWETGFWVPDFDKKLAEEKGIPEVLWPEE